MNNNPTANTLNLNLGLPTITGQTTTPVTVHGYWYHWMFGNENAKTPSYELELQNIWGPSELHDESILIGVNGFFQEFDNCRPCGYEDGLPFIYYDGILAVWNCPC